MKTRKNKIAKILKAGLLCFSISLLLWSCENEEILNTSKAITNDKNIEVTSITLNELYNNKQLSEKIKAINPILDIHLKNIQSRQKIQQKYTVLTDEIIKVQENKIDTYTFRIGNNDYNTYYFENLVIKKEKNTYKYYVYSYEANSDDQIFTLKIKPITSNQLNSSIKQQLNKVAAYDEITSCWYTESFDRDCNCRYVEVNFCHSSGGGGSGGVSSGGSIKTIKDNLNNYNTSGNNSFNTNNTGSNSSSSGISYVGVLNPPLLECGAGYERYFDKDLGPRGQNICVPIEDDIDATQLTGKAKCLNDKLTKNGNTFVNDLLANFNGNSEFDINIKSVQNIFSKKSKQYINGQTKHTKGEKLLNIKISTDKISTASVLSGIRTILHEYIHADIYRKLNTKDDANQDEIKNFKETYEKYEREQHHNSIANVYINSMTQSLKDIHKKILPREYDYFVDGWGVDSLNDLYEALAWQGLKNHKLDAWKNLGNDTTRINKALSNHSHRLTSNCPE